LFAPPANEEGAAVPEGQGEEDYETVNEGLTTDTTEGPTVSRRGGAAGEEDTPEVKATAEANKEEQGIQSDEEDAAAVEKHKSTSKVVADKPLNVVSAKEIKSFEQEGAKKLFESDKAKEEVENRFNYGEQDLEYYGARLQ
jgi:type I site-specific restriction endonuclease